MYGYTETQEPQQMGISKQKIKLKSEGRKNYSTIERVCIVVCGGSDGSGGCTGVAWNECRGITIDNETGLFELRKTRNM